jgi:hypothetical protein
MKKRPFLFPVIVVLVAAAFPIFNLIWRPPATTKLADAKKGDPLFAAAAAVFQTKCAHCHIRDVAFLQTLTGEYEGKPVS